MFAYVEILGKNVKEAGIVYFWEKELLKNVTET